MLSALKDQIKAHQFTNEQFLIDKSAGWFPHLKVNVALQLVFYTHETWVISFAKKDNNLEL